MAKKNTFNVKLVDDRRKTQQENIELLDLTQKVNLFAFPKMFRIMKKQLQIWIYSTAVNVFLKLDLQFN